MSRPINMDGVDLIKDFEGCRLDAYLCPAGVWTIGYGHTGDVKKGDRISRKRADELLAEDLGTFVTAVRRACKVKPNPNQLAAMVSLAFNIGAGAFAKSTVVKAHNRGDAQAAARAFGLWVKARVKGKLVELPGLVSRRAREAALYLKAAKPVDRTPMPQAVAPEPSVSASKDVITAGLGSAGGAAGPIAKVTEIAQQASDIGWTMQTLLDLGPWVLLALVALGAGGYLVWRAMKKRREGRA